jgi:cytochrome P450
LNNPANDRPHAISIPDHVPRDRVVDFDMYNPADNGVDNYYDIWRRLQAPGVPNLIWTPRQGGHWIATRAALIKEVLKDFTRFSNRKTLIPVALMEHSDGIPTHNDPPEHTAYRKILNQYFSPSKVKALEPKIREVCVELIDTFVKDGHCELTSQFSKIFPLRIFMMLSDLPFTDAPRLRSYVMKITHPVGNTPEEMAESLRQGKLAFWDYLAPYIDARITNPGSDYISGIIHARYEGERALTRNEINRMVQLVLQGGLDTVLNFIPFLFDYLARHPEVVSKLRSNLGRVSDHIDEILRRFPLVNEGRYVAQDAVLDGVLVKAGDMILTPTTLAGIDDREFTNPMLVDLDRKRPSHCSFGTGIHTCLGMHLARLEVIVLLEEWLKRIPVFRLKPGFHMQTHCGQIGVTGPLELEWGVTS